MEEELQDQKRNGSLVHLKSQTCSATKVGCEGKVYNQFSTLCGYCLWWVCSQVSGGVPGVNEVNIWEQELDTEQRRSMRKWDLLLMTASVQLCVCQQDLQRVMVTTFLLVFKLYASYSVPPISESYREGDPGKCLCLV